MKICLVAEGCYPYMVGGVSSWVHSMIQAWPQVEFVLLAVIADRTLSGQFKFELPQNLTAVYEVYLNDKDWAHRKHTKRRTRLRAKEYKALQSIVSGDDALQGFILLGPQPGPAFGVLPVGPVLVVQVDLVNRRQVLGELKLELPAQGAVRNDGQQHKLHLGPGLNHAVHPAGNAAHHVGVAALRHQADFQESSLPPFYWNTRISSRVSRSMTTEERFKSSMVAKNFSRWPLLK